MDEMQRAIEYILRKLEYNELRPNQGEVIEQYMKGRDVLFCSPTGSGKSLVFEVAPYLHQYLEKKETGCSCIVISPLSALMKSQVEKLNNNNIKAMYLRDSETLKTEKSKSFEAVLQKLETGHYELIFVSPETLLQGYRETVMKLSRKGYLKVIFVDEAHCIKKFGKTKEGTKTPVYRPYYGCLGEVRSLTGPKVPVVALTATASKTVTDIILRDLGMNDEVYRLTIDPNKKNIKYWMFESTRRRGDISKDFDWLVDLLRKEGRRSPRMIIFFRKIDHIADVFEHLETALGDAAYVNISDHKVNDDRNRLFDMYI